MKPWLKVILYIVLLALTAWAATGFYQNFQASNQTSAANRLDGEGEPQQRKFNSGAQGRMMGFAFGLIGCAIGLGFLVSHDVSRWFATRATDFLYNDNLEGVHNPDYDLAEHAALDGRHLEAIGMLREFLKKNPREIYAAIRIAEIYEKDLQNFLAAALEYEEILKHRFNADRWGWTAIRLVNLYTGKLNKTDAAMEWLNRIVAEHPESAPAKKARERLGNPEIAAAASSEPPSTPPPSSGGLPPGFSPKKK